jgi:ribose 1,5-bisphosphokinase PhnN
MDLVYLAGPPAAGKSTLMAALTAGLHKSPRVQPLLHQVLVNRHTGLQVAVELGKQRDQFPGTDTLAMNVAPVAKRWVREDFPAATVLGEGDRLAFPAFLQAALDGGYRVTLVYVTAHPSVLDARCGMRGSAQNASWRKGRATKASRLAEWAAEHHCEVIEIDTSGGVPPAELANTLRAHVPALRF